MKQKNLALSALLALSITGTAQATLIDKGSGLIYDDVLDITWLQDANYAQTSGHDADGRMTWDNAVAWADGLSYGGYDDWRLPTMTDTAGSGCESFANSGTDCGYNVQTESGGMVFSEMAHMYHNNLGLKSFNDASGTFQSDYGVFGNGTYNGVDTSSFGEKDFALMQNVQASVYWSGVEYVPSPVNAWAFFTDNGIQGNPNKGYELYVWAVRSGDVTVSVPTPVPFWLIGSGFIGLIGWKRKR